MDDTEITNNEYRQFVYWVRDSIAHTIMGDFIEDDFGNESIAIHSVGVLAMAWDHQAIDGAYAAAFLARVKEIIETRDWETELG